MTKEQLRINVGRGLTVDDLKEELADEGAVADFAIGDIHRHDPRAQYCPESFAILSITKAEARARYDMEFSYEWTAYHGCRDANHGDTEFDSLSFTYVRGVAIFEREKVEPRYPDDEF